ncbi:MAG TPA: hypothetical protein DEP87_03740 [Candidatus Pacebacteria bacterium]|nr:hypothetical protein [Candidatus Paceibacterota bacterium]
MSPAVRLIYHTVLLSVTVAWAFVWLKTPNLAHYSLQLFGASVLSYFIIKRLNQAEFWQLLPSPLSLEMSTATLAFLLLIGATGNLHSPLFVLSFVHLFFLALSTHTITALIVTLEICLFHFGLNPEMSTIELSSLASLTVVMGFFLLTKEQFIRIFQQQLTLSKSQQTITDLRRVDIALENLLLRILNRPISDSISTTTLANIEIELADNSTSEVLPETNLLDLETSRPQANPEKLIDEILNSNV